AVTVAPGTTAPLGSETCPVSVPVSTWPEAGTASSTSRKGAQVSLNPFILSSFVLRLVSEMGRSCPSELQSPYHGREDIYDGCYRLFCSQLQAILSPGRQRAESMIFG